MHRVMQDHIGLIMSGELLYWAKWPLTGKIILLIVIALPIYVYYQYKNGSHDFGRQMKGAWWLMFYLIALAGVSLVGSTKFGGLVYLAFGWDPAVVAVIGLVVFLWGVKSGWRTPSVEAIREEAQDHPHQNQLLSPTSTLSKRWNTGCVAAWVEPAKLAGSVHFALGHMGIALPNTNLRFRVARRFTPAPAHPRAAPAP